MSRRDRILKRAFDLVLAGALLIPSLPIIALAALISAIETRTSGFFVQERIGKDGKPFKIVKIRTMYPVDGTSVTTANDSRITKSGRLFRKTKIDELPQLFNILRGEMSFVGPRPDVPGYADRLTGDDRIILSVPPGITGPATLKYRREEELLAAVEDPQKYNDEVIWPDKVRINRDYVQNWSLKKDIIILVKTFMPDPKK
jgi:lipopolysaccharide/colanic/teichoic acid biosynthesis glycosyltransferase